jgi:IS30 family transposase
MGSNMDKASLKVLLGLGLSVAEIGRRFGKDPSTVSYWMQKHGLEAVNREKHAARGGIERELVAVGASITTIAETLGRSPGTVRHRLKKFDLETRSTTQRRVSKAARDAGHVVVQRHCRTHGLTDFLARGSRGLPVPALPSGGCGSPETEDQGDSRR